MKKSCSYLLSLVVLLALLYGCQKHSELSKEKELSSTPLPGQSINCRIESIWENVGSYNQRFLLVLYDQFENPTAITVPMPSTGSPFRVFKYDQWHRLREYIGDYGNGGFEFWHFYGFDLNGRIGIDTMYIFGVLQDKPLNYVNRTIAQFQYDNQGRIIHISTSDHGFNFVETFEYDAVGNLIYPNEAGVTYDNRVNIHRTNDIWMFLARDYSINNPFIADEYIATGFPTIINANNPWDFQFVNTTIFLNHSQVSYSCRQAYW